MDDYINRTALKIAINDYEESHGTMSSMALWKCINEQPSIDAVEVVRCKDCKYSTLFYEELICENNKVSIYRVDNDFFCKWGEKE